MRLLESLINDYIAISKQLSYYVGRKIPAQIDKYEQDQRDAAMKLILALSQYHGFNSDDIEDAMDKALNDA
jgi:hypothetical protein